MVTLENRAPALETPANPSKIGEDGAREASGYEKFRQERIKENLERMEKLGIFNLSLKLKSVKPARKNNLNRKTPHSLSPLTPSGPVRRSSRLQNATPVSYAEVQTTKKDKSLEDQHDLVRDGSKPEVYTEEHEMLLGNTEMSWTFFVDGYGQDGRRIYDPFKGKTCHQCRQKTLGHRTDCSKCGMVQGQFCGDCLYMRYGEHVLEAKQNPNWICPVCRGICNCSLCRQAKGWPPTGPLYKKISQLGFKSVAHYLIQTRRAQTGSDKLSGTSVPVSANRCMPCSDLEVLSEGKESFVLLSPKCEENKTHKEFKGEKQEETHVSENYQTPGAQSKSRSVDSKTDDQSKGEKEEKLHCLENKHGDDNVAEKSSPKLKRKPPQTPDPSLDSIAGRLRLKRRRDSEQDEDLTGLAEGTSNADQQSIKVIASEGEVKVNMSRSSPTIPSTDSIAGRLRSRCKRM